MRTTRKPSLGTTCSVLFCVAGLFLLAIAGSWAALWLEGLGKSGQDTADEPGGKLSVLTEYQNAELGISLLYPREWGEVHTQELEGVPGAAFEGSFANKSGEGLAFVAQTQVFRRRDSGPSTTDPWFDWLASVPGSVPPDEIVEFCQGNRLAIWHKYPDYMASDDGSAAYIGGIATLPGKPYVGIGFAWNYTGESDVIGLPPEAERAAFFRMLRSLRLKACSQGH